jgi:hypothetical protein
MALVLLIGWFLLATNESMRSFYLQTEPGKMLVTLITGLYAAGVYLVLKLTDFEY